MQIYLNSIHTFPWGPIKRAQESVIDSFAIEQFLRSVWFDFPLLLSRAKKMYQEAILTFPSAFAGESIWHRFTSKYLRYT